MTMNLQLSIILSITFSFFCLVSVGQTVYNDYEEIILQEWDTVLYNGSFKKKKIEIPECKISELKAKIGNPIIELAEKESNKELESLKILYKNEGFPSNSGIQLQDQHMYKGLTN